MANDADPRSEELRTQLAAILRANRELGPGYEQVAVDQLVDVVRAHRASDGRGDRKRRAARPAPGAATAPRPAQVPITPGPVRGWGAPWWLWVAAILAAIHWGPQLLRSSGLGFLSWLPIVLVLVVCAKALRAIRRWGRGLEEAWGGGGLPADPPRVRGRAWF